MFLERPPHRALAPFVDRLFARADGAHSAGEVRVLPDGCIDLHVSLEHGRGALIGTMRCALLVPAGEAGAFCAVRFRPGGAAPFLRESAAGLTDRSVEGDDVVPWLGAARFAGLTPASALTRLERTLLGRLDAVRAPDAPVQFVARALYAGAPSVAGLARSLGMSRQLLRARVLDQVGIGPKELGRIARLQRAMDGLTRGKGCSLAQLATAHGYFDQAHMTRDFRLLAGLTPHEARAARHTIFPIRSLLPGPSSRP